MAVDQSISEARLKDDTLSELGLTEQPFVENKKLGRFSDTTSQKIRASLEQKLRFGQSLHLLIGEPGVGKSVFVSQLFKHCKSNLKPFVAKGDDNFSSLAFLAAVQYQLAGEAAEYESVHDYIDDLTPLFDQLADEKTAVVLAIDDAHNAPIEEVAELINLMPAFINDSDEPTARLLLVGEPLLADELNALADEFDEGTFDPTTTTLLPLDESRIPDYLSSRLKQAGFTDAFPFTDKAVTKVLRESEGLPGRVNVAAADYLNKVYAAAPQKSSGAGFLSALGWPLVAMGTAAVGLIAWGLSMFFVGGDPEPVVRVDSTPVVVNDSAAANDTDSAMVAIAPDESTANTGVVIAENDPLAVNQPQDTLTVNPDSDTLPGSDSGNNLIVGSAGTTEQPAGTDDLLKPEDQPIAQSEQPNPITESVAETAPQGQETVTEIVAAPADTVSEAAESTVAAVRETTENTVDAGAELLNTVNDTVSQRAEQISSDASAVADSNRANTADTLAQSIGQGTAQALPESVEVNIPGAITTAAGPESTPAPVADELDTDAAAVSNDTDNGGIAVPVQTALTDSNGVALEVDTVDAAPAIARAVENERWVLFQEAGKFTVQLATSRERGYIIELAQTLPATDPVAIYPFLTTNSKNPVFGLLSGLYDTRDEAAAAVESMPREAKQFGVWIRPIGDLQATIKGQ